MARTHTPRGSDHPVGPETSVTILNLIREARKEAEAGKRERKVLSKQNNDAYLGKQDWGHKQPGQSREFLPMVAMATEQIAGFIKKSLVDNQDWFSVDLRGRAAGILRPEQAVRLLQGMIETRPQVDHGQTDLATLMGDAVKTALWGSLLILKVHGRTMTPPTLDGTVAPPPFWALQIDLINPDDYFPDPTGRGLYEIHRVERDLHEVVEMAEQGIYDKAVVAEITQDFSLKEEESRSHAMRNQPVPPSPDWRKRIILEEYWGTLLGDDGRVVKANIVCTVANDRWVIREPEPNPFWHGQSPFVVAPLVRVPFSVWHKALLDHATQLNYAANELFNLMLDGGIASVWGVRQIRADWLENPSQISAGIPQGATLAVKAETPVGAKVVEQVTTGNIPPEATGMLNLVDRQFQSATLVNDIKLGLLPAKQVKATEIMEASQQSASFFDSLVRDIEQQLMVPLLTKSWLTTLQHFDEVDPGLAIAALGEEAYAGMRMLGTPVLVQEVGRPSAFRVFGLSATISRGREFQRLMTLMQSVSGNPLLLQAFFKEYSVTKIIRRLFATLNIDPDSLKLTPQEEAELAARMETMPQFQQMAGQAQGAQAGKQQDPGLAEINQLSQPLGMFGAAG